MPEGYRASLRQIVITSENADEDEEAKHMHTPT